MYLGQSRTFLAQAFEELDKGDLPQASEKGWGAAAQMVKAVAQERGWRHYSHVSLRHVMDRLYRETGDEELRRQFHFANVLHGNFYENRYSSAVIEDRLRRVEQFVSKRVSKKHWSVLSGGASGQSWRRRPTLLWSEAIPHSPCSADDIDLAKQTCALQPNGVEEPRRCVDRYGRRTSSNSHPHMFRTHSTSLPA